MVLTSREKPRKPRPDFPLQAYGNGQWGKKIRGVRRYFGVWSDPRAAERLYLSEKAAWDAGRDPRAQARGAAGDAGTSLLEIADRYLVSRFRDLQSADEEVRITNKTYSGVQRAMRKLIALFPRADQVYPLQWTPEDFKKLRERLGEGVGINTKAQYVVYARAMFLWAERVSKILPRTLDWGDQFRYVPKHQKDKARYHFQRDHGERRFELDEARDIIRACQRAVDRACDGLSSHAARKMTIGSRLHLAATLLGANAGCYSKDIAALTDRDVDLETGYVESLRTKNGFLWQATLWPETVAAIRAYLEVRPAPARPGWARRLFLTAAGFPPHHEKCTAGRGGLVIHESDALGQATAKLLRELGLKRRGVSFGTWRHTFLSVAAPFGQPHIIQRIVGHEIEGAIDDYMKLRPDQLRPVTDGVRGLLLGVGGQNEELRSVA